MKTKPHVLVIWRGFFPSWQRRSMVGPISPIAYEIFPRVAKKGFAVSLICWHLGPEPYTETIEGMRIIRVKRPSCKYFTEQVWGLKMSILSLYEMVKGKIDLVHILGEPVWHGWAAFIARLAGIPVLMSFLDPWYPLFLYEEKGRRKDILRACYFTILKTIIPILERLFARYATMVTVVTESLRDYYHLYGIPGRKVFVIPNAATPRNSESSKVVDLRNMYQLTDEDTVIGYLGSIRRIRGVELLLKAFLTLAEERRDIKLIYIGDGEDSTLLKNQIPVELEDRVIFTGRVAHDEVPSYLCLIDCGFISWDNNLAMSCASPLKLFEYMACKKPVVGGCTRHIRDIIEESCGGIFMENWTVESAIEALGKFLNLPRSERNKLGENAYQYIARFHNWDTVADRYGEIYQTLVGQQVQRTLRESYETDRESCPTTCGRDRKS